MRLTRQEDYGLIFMAELAQYRGDGFVSVAKIAKKYHISQPFLNRIAQDLKKAGFLRSKEGRGGGYQLKKKAHLIRIGQILNALGKHKHINLCFSICQRRGFCKYRQAWDRMDREMSRSLNRMTLRSLIR